jgi:Co/Zn/Cd efflux system component
MSGQCCSNAPFDGIDKRYIKILWLVIAVNGLMFVVEMLAGVAGQSQALQADALDFLGDTLTYGISLWAIGKSIHIRSNAALLKSFSLFGMALWVFFGTLYRVFHLNDPSAMIMGSVAVLALLANLLSVFLLARYKDGDANVRSVWLCSRNDAIGNVVVILAASAAWGSNTPWPDLIVACFMGGLFMFSSITILKQAWQEKKQGEHKNISP